LPQHNHRKLSLQYAAIALGTLAIPKAIEIVIFFGLGTRMSWLGLGCRTKKRTISGCESCHGSAEVHVNTKRVKFERGGSTQAKKGKKRKTGGKEREKGKENKTNIYHRFHS